MADAPVERSMPWFASSLAASAERAHSTFLASVAVQRPIIFCVGCGSTNVDQNTRHQLRCYTCHAASAFDSRRFSIARDGDPWDVAQATSPSPEGDGLRDAISSTLDSIFEFANLACDAQMARGTNSSEAVQSRLIAKWNAVKRVVDVTLANHDKSKD